VLSRTVAQRKTAGLEGRPSEREIQQTNNGRGGLGRHHWNCKERKSGSKRGSKPAGGNTTRLENGGDTTLRKRYWWQTIAQKRK